MKPEPIELRFGQTYAVTYYHEDGPLLGLVAEVDAVEVDDCVLLTDTRTDERLVVQWRQLCTAQIVDGPYQSDAEVEALLREQAYHTKEQYPLLTDELRRVAAYAATRLEDLLREALEDELAYAASVSASSLPECYGSACGQATYEQLCDYALGLVGGV